MSESHIKFFTKKELKEFSAIAGSVYQKGNPDQLNIASKIKSGIFTKTEAWAKNLCQILRGFEYSTSNRWSERGWDGKGNRASLFKTYTWARIYKQGDQGKGIFFTVGVNADPLGLCYKLDYHYSGSEYLSDEQKKICKTYLENSDAHWKIIEANELNHLNWKNLISITNSFINRYEKLYDDIIQAVWQKCEKRIARLIWNTNGWIYPSGPAGKSSEPRTHEGKFAYGHEEWLLDVSRRLDGYHYGYLEPVRKKYHAYSGRIFDVELFTIFGTTKQRFWIGSIQNLQIIDSKEAQKVYQEYRKRGWLEEMASQLVSVGASAEEFWKWQDSDLFNVRYQPKNLKTADPYLELSNEHPALRLSRYVFAKTDEILSPFNLGSEEFTFQSEDEGKNETVKKATTYERNAKTVEMQLLHQNISAKLARILKEQHGSENVTKEHPVSGQGGNKIDIVVNIVGKGMVFYEIKTYNSPVACIREAIGQLLEYSYWLKEQRAKELIIIAPQEARIHEVKEYMNHLRNTFRLPLYFQFFDIESGYLSDKL